MKNKAKLIIMKVHTTWCEPCHRIKPEVLKNMDKLSHEDAFKVLLELDRDQNTDVCSWLRIRAFPTIISFVWGEPYKVFMGTDTQELYEFFKESDEHYRKTYLSHIHELH
jgi:thioredoxin-like negative regulator of GroEL